MSVTALDHRPPGIPLGPLVGVAVNVLYLVAWIVARPATGFTPSYISQILGVQAIVFFVWSLLVNTVLPGLEWLYGGLDQQVKWHRYAAIAGFVAIVVHRVVAPVDAPASQLGQNLGGLAGIGLVILILWALMPPSSRAAKWRGPLGWLARQPFNKWQLVHRFIGVFLIVAMVHGFLEGTSLAAPLLWWLYMGISALGVLLYLYREFVMLKVVPRSEYDVVDVRRVDKRTLIMSLKPVKGRVNAIAGQFAFIHFDTDGWGLHPFTIASAPDSPLLEFGIRVSGDDTQRLYDNLAPGARAIVSRPHGSFNYAAGASRQAWVSGGIGITPFVSWLRSLDDQFDRVVDLHVAARNEAESPYAADLRALVAHHPSVTLITYYSDDGEGLTAELVARRLGEARREASIYMCGPRPMMKAFESGLSDLGVPRGHITWEDFNVR